MKPKASIALAIMGKGKPAEGPSETESPAEESDEMVGLESAFAALRQAIESGDDKAGAEALKSFWEQC